MVLFHRQGLCIVRIQKSKIPQTPRPKKSRGFLLFFKNLSFFVGTLCSGSTADFDSVSLGSIPNVPAKNMEDDAAGLVRRPALKTGFSEMGWGSTPPSSANYGDIAQRQCNSFIRSRSLARIQLSPPISNYRKRGRVRLIATVLKTVGPERGP